MKAANLMLRMDESAKRVVVRAATLRGVSTSNYVREVVVAQARRELDEARTGTIALSPADQRAFWDALQRPVKLTAGQRKLSRLMRGR